MRDNLLLRKWLLYIREQTRGFNPDPFILVPVAVLFILGLIYLQIISSFLPDFLSQSYVLRKIIEIIPALIVLIFFSLINYRKLSKIIIPVLLFFLAYLIAHFLYNQATWGITIFHAGISIDQLIALAVVLYMILLIESKGTEEKLSPVDLIPPFIIVGFFSYFLLLSEEIYPTFEIICIVIILLLTMRWGIDKKLHAILLLLIVTSTIVLLLDQVGFKRQYILYMVSHQLTKPPYVPTSIFLFENWSNLPFNPIELNILNYSFLFSILISYTVLLFRCALIIKQTLNTFERLLGIGLFCLLVAQIVKDILTMFYIPGPLSSHNSLPFFGNSTSNILVNVIITGLLLDLSRKQQVPSFL